MATKDTVPPMQHQMDLFVDNNGSSNTVYVDSTYGHRLENPMIAKIFKASDVSQKEKMALADALLELVALGCVDVELSSCHVPNMHSYGSSPCWRASASLPSHVTDVPQLEVAARATTLDRAVHELLMLMNLYTASKAISTPAYMSP